MQPFRSGTYAHKRKKPPNLQVESGTFSCDSWIAAESFLSATGGCKKDRKNHLISRKKDFASICIQIDRKSSTKAHIILDQFGVSSLRHLNSVGSARGNQGTISFQSNYFIVAEIDFFAVREELEKILLLPDWQAVWSKQLNGFPLMEQIITS